MRCWRRGGSALFFFKCFFVLVFVVAVGSGVKGLLCCGVVMVEVVSLVLVLVVEVCGGGTRVVVDVVVLRLLVFSFIWFGSVFSDACYDRGATVSF